MLNKIFPGGKKRRKNLVTLSAVRGKAFETLQQLSKDNFFRRTTSTLTQHDCRSILCMCISILPPIHLSIRPTIQLPVWFSILSFIHASNDLPINFSTFFCLHEATGQLKPGLRFAWFPNISLTFGRNPWTPNKKHTEWLRPYTHADWNLNLRTLLEWWRKTTHSTTRVDW